MFCRSIQQPNITTFSEKSSESVEDFLDEVHLAFTHIADAHTKQKDKETTRLHLIKSHCDDRAKKYIRSLPEGQRAKAADLISALKSAFDNADEESREARPHGAVLELKQKKGNLQQSTLAVLAVLPTTSTQSTII